MRILLVEDEHLIAQSIKKGLEQEAYAVDIAYDGSDGLDLALAESYDCAVLDRMLPGVEGLEIVRQMRAEKINTPVLILTAKDQMQDKVEGLNSGADDYLAKPFAFEELLARIRALTRRPHQTMGEELTVNELTLNPTTFEVRRQDHLINLSNKEFALLEYLMRHPGQILSKAQIISHVWNYDDDVLPNTVEVYIGYLRRKIDQPFGKSSLKTVRGFGYKIEDR